MVKKEVVLEEEVLEEAVLEEVKSDEEIRGMEYFKEVYMKKEE